MKIYLSKGYNSWTNRTNQRVFKNIQEAKSYTIGLTDSKILMLSGKTYLDCLNKVIDTIEGA